MSKLTKNPLAKVFERNKYSEKLKKAESNFAFKTFTEQFSKLEQALKYGRTIFHLFSILTAFTFLFLLFESFLNSFVISGMLAGSILIFWEYSKSNILQNTFYSYYRNSKIPFALSIVSLVMLSGSVFTSLQGAKEYFQKNHNKTEDFQEHITIKVDSLNNLYAIKIENTESDLNKFKDQVTYLGKIDISNKSVAKTIDRYNQEILLLKKEREISLKQLSESLNNDLKKVSSQSEFNLIAFICLSGINELLIVICSWFLVYFEFRLFKESEVFKPHEQNYTFSTASLNKFAELVLMNNQHNLIEANHNIEEPTKSIGFQHSVHHSVKQVNSSQNQVKTPLSNTKIQGLVSDIQSGITDYRTLMKRNSVNVLTVKKYLELYDKK
tara:strand:+ start:3508 stop:4656 length:1149 start_codon:yes stop_codon:yes gene_type:complete